MQMLRVAGGTGEKFLKDIKASRPDVHRVRQHVRQWASDLPVQWHYARLPPVTWRQPERDKAIRKHYSPYAELTIGQ
ncbi:hypothetical protein OkiPb00243_24100 [Escherichia coli]